MEDAIADADGKRGGAIQGLRRVEEAGWETATAVAAAVGGRVERAVTVAGGINCSLNVLKIGEDLHHTPARKTIETQ